MSEYVFILSFTFFLASIIAKILGMDDDAMLLLFGSFCCALLSSILGFLGVN